jgi:predicted nucleic acid-binding protein
VTLVDSSVWIDYFRGTTSKQTERLNALLAAEPVAIGDLMLTEVLQGFDGERQFSSALRLLTSLSVIDIAGRDIAVQAARNFRALRAHGVTGPKTVDTLIATRCIESGYGLLYSGRDFDPFVEHLGLHSALD